VPPGIGSVDKSGLTHKMVLVHNARRIFELLFYERPWIPLCLWFSCISVVLILCNKLHSNLDNDCHIIVDDGGYASIT